MILSIANTGLSSLAD